MLSDSVRFAVPARASFARSVRMLASTLAVANDFSVDDVEDVRMAAEEGFVYTCSTGVDECEIEFGLAPGQVSMEFKLGQDESEGSGTPAAKAGFGDDLDLVELLLEAVCDEFDVVEGAACPVLRLVKRAGYDA